MVNGILEVSRLSKSFDGLRAVDGVSMTVPAGSIVSLIGPNGAGKTTLFNLLTGFLRSDSGGVRFDDRVLNHLPPYQIARRGIGRTFQNLRLIGKLTARENVLLAFQQQSGEGLWGAMIGRKRLHEERRNCERAAALLEFVGLSEAESQLAEELSYGQQKLLSLACCQALETRLLLLDEPVAGVQPETVKKILDLLKKLQRQGKTIVFIEHNLNAVAEVADRVVVMDEGKVIADGPPQAVMEDQRVVEAYLA